MKLKQIKLKNFRSYQSETSIDIDNLTAFVGRNDIGKSTVLEALDIFLNDGAGAVKIDANDVCKSSSDSSESDITISEIFSDLPDEIIIDDSSKTSFTKEHLLNEDENLEVVKRYPNGGKAKVFIKAKHPTNPECADLLLKNQKDLRACVRNPPFGNTAQVLDKHGASSCHLPVTASLSFKAPVGQ